MAKAWIATRWGSPDGWELAQVAVPAPGPGEVTIRVRAAGVNPADAKHVAVEQPGVSLPVPIGYEVSGELSAIGPGAMVGGRRAAIGDEVIAFRVRGGYATELTVPCEKVFAKPSVLTHPEAANLLLVGTAAAEMLAVTRAAPGETVLLHGASGGVGVSVLQQAAVRGIRVIGTSSPARFDVVRRYGGIPVAYGAGLEHRVRDAAAGEPIAAALDAAGTDEAMDASLALVADRARIVAIAGPRLAAAHGVTSIRGSLPESARFRDSARAGLIALADSGRLQVPVSATFPLAEAPTALQLLAGRKLALIP